MNLEEVNGVVNVASFKRDPAAPQSAVAAEASGIAAGDRLLGMGGVSFVGMSLSAIVEAVKGIVAASPGRPVVARLEL